MRLAIQSRIWCIGVANKCDNLCSICGTACIATLATYPSEFGEFLPGVARSLSRLSCELREQRIRGMQLKKSHQTLRVRLPIVVRLTA